MLFDTHAHIDDEKFDGDREAVLERALENGVTRLLNVGADMASSRRSVELAGAHEMVYAAVGVHPHEVAGMTDGDYELLARWAKEDKVVAIGEIGLDYYYDLSPREDQKRHFAAQLDLARQTGLPVVVHDRDAHGDTMEILKREGKGLAGVVHCFAGSLEMASELVKMGWYLGVDGPVTFKNAAKLPEIMKKIPLERILIETDSPYLTPVPLRGRRNEPSFVRYVAEHVAKLRNMEFEAFARAAAQNACRLFQIK